MPVDRDRYRALAGSFPTGLAVVTTRDTDGAMRGLTTQTFVGLSMDPPLVTVSLDVGSRTLAAVRRSRALVVSFLKAGSEEVATGFASKAEDKFAGIDWRPSSVAAGAPILLSHSVAYAECLLRDVVMLGDHALLIGLVEGGEVRGGAPLMYYGRAYLTWSNDRESSEQGSE